MECKSIAISDMLSDTLRFALYQLWMLDALSAKECFLFLIVHICHNRLGNGEQNTFGAGSRLVMHHSCFRLTAAIQLGALLYFSKINLRSQLIQHSSAELLYGPGTSNPFLCRVCLINCRLVLLLRQTLYALLHPDYDQVVGAPLLCFGPVNIVSWFQKPGQLCLKKVLGHKCHMWR